MKDPESQEVGGLFSDPEAAHRAADVLSERGAETRITDGGRALDQRAARYHLRGLFTGAVAGLIAGILAGAIAWAVGYAGSFGAGLILMAMGAVILTATGAVAGSLMGAAPTSPLAGDPVTMTTVRTDVIGSEEAAEELRRQGAIDRADPDRAGRAVQRRRRPTAT